VVAGLGAQRSILNCASFQYHGQDLVVGLDGYGQDLRFSNASLVTLKPTMMVPFRAVPASSLASGESAGSELSFKAGNAW